MPFSRASAERAQPTMARSSTCTSAAAPSGSAASDVHSAPGMGG